jgi:RNA polymerase sigma-70 factor (ECF subfamily)
MRSMMGEHFRFVARTLRKAGAPRWELDDSIQRTFIVAARRLDTTPVAAERQFLRGVAQNVASHARRTYARRREVPGDVPERADLFRTPEHLIERKRIRELIDRVLDQMDPSLSAVLTLHALEEMNLTEIAAILAIPRGTAASRLRRARAQFLEHAEEIDLAWEYRTPRTPQGLAPLLRGGVLSALERALLTVGASRVPLRGLRKRTLAALGLGA